MTYRDFVPTRDAQLATFSANFQTLVAANFASYGLTSAQSAAFTSVNSAWLAAYTAASNDGTRTPAAIMTKLEARRTMVQKLRELARIVQAYPGTTNTMRTTLGLTVPSQRQPIPAPSQSPTIDVKTVVGRTITIRLHNNSASRGKPAGVDGAAVFSYVGSAPPANIDDWKFEGNTTRTLINVEFGSSIPAFSQVWLTAFWFNPRGQSGAACEPINTFLGTWGNTAGLTMADTEVRQAGVAEGRVGFIPTVFLQLDSRRANARERNRPAAILYAPLSL